jgi:hypothetical protein
MFTQRLSLTAQNARKVSSTKVHRLGSVAETADGRVYRYASAGASNLVAGNLQVNAGLVANHTNRTVAATVAAGQTVVSVNLGATAATANQYADGFMTVNDSTGEGIQYGVAGNDINAGSAASNVYLQGDEPLVVGLTVSVSEVTLKLNTWASTVLSATGQADQPVGVPNVAVTAAYYYWAQTGGECSVLADASTMTKGVELTISAATAGAVGLKDAAGEVKVGVASEALVSTENRAAYLTMF